MYSPRQSYGSPPPELSNNPFIDHPANALTRYPDITGGSDYSGGSNPVTSYSQSSTSNYGNSYQPVGAQQQQLGFGGGYQQPQQTGWSATPAGYPQQIQQQGYVTGMASPRIQSQPTGLPFQPTSSFGQQLAAYSNAYGSVPQPQQQQPQYTGYGVSPYATGYQSGYPSSPPQQPARPQPSVAEFDPYSQQSQGSAGAGSRFAPPSNGSSQYKSPHPREYVHQHKAELESWDTYAWTQLLNSFEALKNAWDAVKRDIEARGRALGGASMFAGGQNYGGYGQAQELARLEQLSKEAENNHNSVAASIFQLKEVQKGYRQSADLASKRRVRESLNAALKSLPEWPPQQY